MDFSRAVIIVVLTLALVVVINVVLYVALTRKNAFFEIDLLRKAAGRARDPWKREDDALKELSQRVQELKSRKPENESPDEEPHNE